MGTIIYCNNRARNDHELSTLPHIHLSSSPTWDPHNVVFPSHCVEEEEHKLQILQTSSISSLSSCANDLTSTLHDPMTFHSRLISNESQCKVVSAASHGSGVSARVIVSDNIPLARRGQNSLFCPLLLIWLLVAPSHR